MEISIINGSPEPGHSTSGYIIDLIVPRISEGNILEIYNISRGNLQEGQFVKIQNCDVLVLAFPLYVDSIPSHMLRFMAELEERGFASKNTMVYCIINNGFFEGKQNRIATMQVKNWCKRTGLVWGQAIGAGAGEMIPMLKDIPMGHGPNKSIFNVLECFSANIMGKKAGEDIYFSPDWPRWLWKIQASFCVWYPRARANKLTKRDLYAAGK